MSRIDRFLIEFQEVLDKKSSQGYTNTIEITLE